MVGPKRSHAQRELDLVRLSAMYLAATPQNVMASTIGVSPKQIRYDLRKLHARWVRAQLINVDEGKARELSRIDKIEAEAWVAWEKSKGRKRKKKLTEGVVSDVITESEVRGIAAKQETTEWIENGDTRYMDTIRWCVERRCAILGLNAPIKTEHKFTDDTTDELIEQAKRMGLTSPRWGDQLLNPGSN